MFGNCINKIIIVPLLVVATYSFAQENQDKPTYTVNIEKRDTAIKCEVLYEKQTFVPKEDVTYFWFASNKIISTQGGYDGRLLSGNYVSYFPNKSLKEKGLFKKGIKTGKWIYWYPNGKISETINWKYGRKNGKYEGFNEQGFRVIKTNFKNDKLSGHLTTYQDGEITASTKYINGIEIDKKIKKTKAPKENKKKKEDKIKEEPVTEPTSITTTNTKKEKKSFFGNLFKKKNKKPATDPVIKPVKEKDTAKLNLKKSKKNKTTENK